MTQQRYFENAYNPNLDYDELHVDKAWAYLNRKFGFPIRQWKREFNEFRSEFHKQRTGHDHTLVGDFYYFGNLHINPILNSILCRPNGYPSFDYLMEYITTGRPKSFTYERKPPR
jgi:hypothetical protein